MIRVYTTPTGRQLLLSNLVVRNSLYGKVLTVIVDQEDAYDAKKNLITPKMRIYVPGAEEPLFQNVYSDEAHEVFNNLVK